MPNPRYHDDPEWYEHPGELVHLDVAVKPLVAQINTPWMRDAYAGLRPDHSNLLFGISPYQGIDTPNSRRCAVCHRYGVTDVHGLCAACMRCQYRAMLRSAEDDTSLATPRVQKTP